MTKKTDAPAADETFLGASMVLIAAILVPGLIATFLTDDFWLILATMAVGAFVGLVIQARTEKSPEDADAPTRPSASDQDLT